ncbi:MAG: universal stress protein, partial [Actinomycetota bacterium]|nr:universal stress protein [Actinomycetota bacterium]
GEQLVVVGVDGSPASYTALRWALSHAGRTGARVRAIRCWMPVMFKAWEVAITAEPVPTVAEQRGRAERELAQAVAAAWLWVPNAAGQIDVEQKARYGLAGPTLVSAAADAGLLVVGHGHHVIDLMHRSVSWYCLRHAQCPVLVIPAAATSRKTLLRAVQPMPAVETAAVTTVTGMTEVMAVTPVTALTEAMAAAPVTTITEAGARGAISRRSKIGFQRR